MDRHPKHKPAAGTWLATMALAGLLGACQGGPVAFHSYQPLAGERWAKADTAVFAAAVADSASTYRLSLQARHRGNYPYRNLSVALSVTGPDSTLVCTDTLEAELAGADGLWKENNWEELHQADFPSIHIPISRPGEYLFKLNYIFPDTVLPGICDLGLRLERAGQHPSPAVPPRP